MRGIKIPQQDFAQKMQGGGAYVRGGAYLGDTIRYYDITSGSILERKAPFEIIVYKWD